MRLEECLDDLESHNRGKNLVLSGTVPSKDSDNLSQSVIDLLKTKVNYVLPPDSIVSIYRIGPNNASQFPNMRNMMIKLRDRATKKDIVSAFRSVKPSNLYANDDLTPHRSKLLYLLRVAKRKFPNKILACGSMDSNVYAYLKPPNPVTRSQRLLVNNMRKLEELCVRELDTSLEAITGEPTRE